MHEHADSLAGPVEEDLGNVFEPVDIIDETDDLLTILSVTRDNL